MTLLRYISFVLLLHFSMAVIAQNEKGELSAEKQQELINELEQQIEILKSDKERLADIIEEGRQRTILCRTCHGQDGIAVKELTPNLAGQNPVYIVDQFQRFGDGRRYDYFMSSLAKSFSDKDKIKIALYYANLESRASGGGKQELLPEGKEIYQSVCHDCHGEDGHGQEGYARLAGQRDDYVVKMLKEFRDRTGRRSNPWMSAVALKLSEQQMEAVATYVANLK